jgi:hypothetical protein
VLGPFFSFAAPKLGFRAIAALADQKASFPYNRNDADCLPICQALVCLTRAGAARRSRFANGLHRFWLAPPTLDGAWRPVARIGLSENRILNISVSCHPCASVV